MKAEQNVEICKIVCSIYIVDCAICTRAVFLFLLQMIQINTIIYAFARITLA